MSPNPLARKERGSMETKLRDMEYPSVLGYALNRDTLTPIRVQIRVSSGDYGRDPIGDGRFRMVPSGDVVTFEESENRLKGAR